MDEVARDLEVPYVVMEDALCMWQKKPKKRSSEQLPDDTYPPFIPIHDVRRARRP